MSTRKMSSLIVAAACIALTLGVAGCSNAPTQDNSAQSQPAPTDQTQDPQVAANLPPVSATDASYQQDRNRNDSGRDDDYDTGDEDTSYGQPVLYAQQPPPPLPEYSQPDCPGDGYLWTPGYWSYSDQGYYWVPGAWARPPEVGYLWTPGYWGYSGGRYRYNYGHWGRHIGYYGGINYGNGYVGVGYQGGDWSGDRFNYNRSVNNVTITNVHVYNSTVTNTVINNVTITNTTSHASYAGPGGVTRRPVPAELAATREQRIPPMTTQIQQKQEAAQNRQQFANVNHGRPAVVVATKPIPEGKPIAAAIPAHAAPAARPAPASPQANRSQAPAERATSTAPAKPAEKPAEPPRTATQPAAKPATAAQPAPAHAKPAAKSAEPAKTPAQPAAKPAPAAKSAPAPAKPAARPAEPAKTPAQPAAKPAPAAKSNAAPPKAAPKAE